MATYKVGIMSDVKLVEAPNAEAAAVFYGWHTAGNAGYMAVVYECDGSPVEAAHRTPLLRYQFGDSPSAETVVRWSGWIKQCRFVEKAA